MLCLKAPSALGVVNLRWNRSLTRGAGKHLLAVACRSYSTRGSAGDGLPRSLLRWGPATAAGSLRGSCLECCAGCWLQQLCSAAQLFDSSAAPAGKVQERPDTRLSAAPDKRVGASPPWTRGNGSKGFSHPVSRAAGHACWKLPQLPQAHSPVASLAL